MSGMPTEVQPLLSPCHSNVNDGNYREGKLSTFLGVVVPCILSIFSVILFLRLGFVVGQAGFLTVIGMLVLAYGLCIKFTAIPGSTWWQYLYGSLVLLFCLIVCVFGAGIFAKTSLIIFLAVMVAISSSVVSFIAQKAFAVNNQSILNENETVLNFAYTGWDIETFRKNLYSNYTEDITTGIKQDFQSVFAVLFNGCTGIMVTFTSFTCSRGLLLNNYNYIQAINLCPPLITIGVFAATLSAALSTLIGASRILEAVARDDILDLIPQIIIIAKELNAIAPIVTMFYLLSYGATNFACFLLRVASAPNFSTLLDIYVTIIERVALTNEKHRSQFLGWLSFADKRHLKAFVEITTANCVRDGARNLMLDSQQLSSHDYVGIIKDAIMMQKNVLIVVTFNSKLSPSIHANSHGSDCIQCVNPTPSQVNRLIRTHSSNAKNLPPIVMAHGTKTVTCTSV
ncbi:uncharacterized protein TRIADDRAFT_59688 [Trichoplax adhaerens]|uniref:Amino acid permease/ SLC12A domain-containing protein n=1 Tax=Trichoplax adhaerens TaxID=10228 RepID=B3S662_TRIAD|nr:hypothetical protein TRIADDRAFT_59688 [Trichoplax adhaerens]EDV21701.1 hypothetical protein TRIADDRAFT_59688 [Trichoplax adhaerens]|eukprot:XP_002115849.1 hypothetical protein TRIADDRAFT_59688 [Trichoplax adhaerens]